MSTGDSHAGAIDIEQNVYLWGKGKHGQLGAALNGAKNVLEPKKALNKFDTMDINPKALKCVNDVTFFISMQGQVSFLGRIWQRL